MPKQKSSASSATRKKHARKAAAVSGVVDAPSEQQKKAKGVKKDKHAPKVKQYIPPSKPAPIRPDPLDVGGLASRIDPDVLVVLRRLGKKDAVTKQRALDELTQLTVSNRDALVEGASVWVHHFPALALHPARRVRALTASTHAALLPLLLDVVDLVPLLGPWGMLAHDVDRAVGIAARPAWDSHGSPLFARGEYERETVLEFVSRAVIDPAAVHAELNPSPPPPPSSNKRGVGEPVQREKTDSDEEAPSDRAARLRVGALGVLGWIASTVPAERPDVLHTYELWSCLAGEPDAFGYEQPGVRRAAWVLLGILASRGLQEEELASIAPAVLHSAWVETDAGVRAAMWEPLLVFLTKFPRAWNIEHGVEDEDSGDEEQHRESRAFTEFLDFLTLGCGGSPARGYPTVLVIASTIPPDILSDGKAFFAAFWGAVDGRALSTPDASRAFIPSLVECTLFFASRKYANTLDIAQQFSRAWEALVKKELRGVSAISLAEGLNKLSKLSEEAFSVAWTSVAQTTEVEVATDTVDRTHVVRLLRDLRARHELSGLVSSLARSAAARKDDTLLVHLLESFGDQLVTADDFSTDLAVYVGDAHSVPLTLRYLVLHPDTRLWHTLLAHADRETLATLVSSLPPALHTLRPSGGELDELVDSLLSDALSGTSSPELLAKLLQRTAPFLSGGALQTLRGRIESCVSVTTDAALRETDVDLAPARAALSLGAVGSKAFVLSQLVPGTRPQGFSGVALRDADRDGVLHELHDLLLDVNVLATASEIVRAARLAEPDAGRILGLLFPPQNEMERMRLTPSKSYERIMAALVPFLTDERALARQNMWLVAHMALLPATDEVDTLLAYLLLPPDDISWHTVVVDSIIGSKKQTPNSLGDVVAHSVRTCSSERQAQGVERILARLLRGGEVQDAEAWVRAARALERPAPHACRAILRTISATALEPPLLVRYRTELASTLSGVPPAKCNTEGLRLLRALNASAPDARGEAELVPQQRAVFLMKTIERWIADADEIEEGLERELAELFLALATVLQTVPGRHWEVVLDVVENGLEAATDAEANERDIDMLLRTLRLLVRIVDLAAVTKMLRLEYWASREKNIMALVLKSLELHASSNAHDLKLPAQDECIELLINLATHIPSSTLNYDSLGKLVHLLSSGSSAVLEASYPLLQRAAAKRTEYLVIESAANVLTVEATAAEDGVETPPPVADADSLPKIVLPDELLALVQVQLDIELDEIDGGESHALLSSWQSMLFAWMLVFDSFVDASEKVKNAFMEQMRDLDLVESFFAPHILGILGVIHSTGGSVSRKPFKLDAWVVEEFYTSLYDATSTLSPRLLSAHLFFRALDTVPTLVRAWFLKSKDRQLHTAVTAYVTSYFAPPLVASAFAPLRALPADSELKADGWAVRVGGGTEALLTYTVDEQSLEVALRLPGEWPLRGAEAREVRRVGGIPESRWRAWVFGLQQVAARGVIDGLLHFRKNVAGHFEGQVECAICYCIISVTDQSLPTKPCRTCKNRFHSSCLYKWFKSSHATSCPLCRTDIL